MQLDDETELVSDYPLKKLVKKKCDGIRDLSAEEKKNNYVYALANLHLLAGYDVTLPADKVNVVYVRLRPDRRSTTGLNTSVFREKAGLPYKSGKVYLNWKRALVRQLRRVWPTKDLFQWTNKARSVLFGLEIQENLDYALMRGGILLPEDESPVDPADNESQVDPVEDESQVGPAEGEPTVGPTEGEPTADPAENEPPDDPMENDSPPTDVQIFLQEFRLTHLTEALSSVTTMADLAYMESDDLSVAFNLPLPVSINLFNAIQNNKQNM